MEPGGRSGIVSVPSMVLYQQSKAKMGAWGPSMVGEYNRGESPNPPTE